MKKYCFDTSGISNPVENQPDDLYGPIWRQVIIVIEAGEIAVTTEIYEEMHCSIRSMVGECIDANRHRLVLEIENGSWDDAAYATVATDMQLRHHKFIAEFNNNRRGTVGLNDISIVALAKALDLPLVSMEKPASVNATARRKIPDICRIEQVEHLTFNKFLRREGIGMS